MLFTEPFTVLVAVLSKMDVEEALPFDNCESPERRPARAAILRGSVKSDDPVHSQPSGERPFSGLPKTLASAAREVSVGTLASLLVLVMNVGSAGIVFHEADESDALHALNGNVADAVTICLLCTTVGGLAISLNTVFYNIYNTINQVLKLVYLSK